MYIMWQLSVKSIQVSLNYLFSAGHWVGFRILKWLWKGPSKIKTSDKKQLTSSICRFRRSTSVLSLVQAALEIRGFFICEFAYSRFLLMYGTSGFANFKPISLGYSRFLYIIQQKSIKKHQDETNFKVFKSLLSQDQILIKYQSFN